ncbi:hypothetical protein N7481_006387, partial [Penicillium waksmanii]|uniref:uncharacterized protein n=1 Tax=Penicillium waksmanii TaxID=69791 RepID=UPI00254776DE
TLTLSVRSRYKVPTKVADNKRVAIIEGTLEDEDALDEVSRCGADTSVSFAGPPAGNKGMPLTNGYRALIPKLVSQGIKRVLILCTPSYKEWTIKAISSTRGQYWEMISVGGYITSLLAEDGIKWTLFRVGGLTNGEMRLVEATFLGSGRDGMWISRASVAEWVMDEAIQEKWVREMPYICN